MADLVVQTVIGDLDITLLGVAAGPFVQIDDVIIFQLKHGQRRAPAKKDSALGAIDHNKVEYLVKIFAPGRNRIADCYVTLFGIRVIPFKELAIGLVQGRRRHGFGRSCCADCDRRSRYHPSRRCCWTICSD